MILYLNLNALTIVRPLIACIFSMLSVPCINALFFYMFSGRKTTVAEGVCFYTIFTPKINNQ